MLFYLTSRILCSLTSFIYPAYASYKTLSQRPASEVELERWLQYWAVLGCVVGVEYAAEWAVNWIPFYYFFKTLFLLYLSLPQTRGSQFIYTTHLEPFLHSHEDVIDSALASFKSKLYSFLQERMQLLWNTIAAGMGQQQQAQAHFEPVTGPGAAGAPPSLADPVSGPAQLVSTFWRSYGPGIIGGAAQLLRQSSAMATPASSAFITEVPATPAATPPQLPAHVRSNMTQSVLDRRRQLEAELAALHSDDEASQPAGLKDRVVSVGSFTSSPSRSNSEVNVSMRERKASSAAYGGKFEEVEAPSDTEGSSDGSNRPAGPAQRGSWFGWGGSPKAGYEHVKSD